MIGFPEVAMKHNPQLLVYLLIKQPATQHLPTLGKCWRYLDGVPQNGW